MGLLKKIFPPNSPFHSGSKAYCPDCKHCSSHSSNPTSPTRSAEPCPDCLAAVESHTGLAKSCGFCVTVQESLREHESLSEKVEPVSRSISYRELMPKEIVQRLRSLKRTKKVAEPWDERRKEKGGRDLEQVENVQDRQEKIAEAIDSVDDCCDRLFDSLADDCEKFVYRLGQMRDQFLDRVCEKCENCLEYPREGCGNCLKRNFTRSLLEFLAMHKLCSAPRDLTKGDDEEIATTRLAFG